MRFNVNFDELLILKGESLMKAEEERVEAEVRRAAAESGRETAEESRVSAEHSRTEAEAERETAETERQAAFDAAQEERANEFAAAETTRTTAETGRVNAESARVIAETGRAAEFATWENEINSKAKALIKSASGNIVQIYADEDSPIRVKAYIEATQVDGTLDDDGNVQDPSPDNIRAIVGVDSVNLTIGGEDALTNSDNRTTYTIALPETSYGGYIDWTRGEYVQTHKRLVFNGAESWQAGATYKSGVYRLENRQIADINVSTLPTDIFDGVCSHFAITTANNTYMARNGISAYLNNQNCLLHIYSPDFDTGDVAIWKAYLAAQYEAGTPVTLVYQLKSPIKHDLTLPVITALDGVTTVFSDQESVEVGYNANALHIIGGLEERIATLEGLITAAALTE